MNIQAIVAAVIGIIIGVLGSIAFMPQSAGQVSTDEHAGHEMDHKGIEIEAGKTIPTVSIMAHKDSMSGFNIHVTAQNFSFTPEKAGADAIQGQGHAHVYVNGKKVMRLYGEWAHIPGEAFADGENTISVTLNANDHSDWLVSGEHIEASTVVTK